MGITSRAAAMVTCRKLQYFPLVETKGPLGPTAISSALDEAVAVVKEHAGMWCHTRNRSAVQVVSCAAEHLNGLVPG